MNNLLKAIGIVGIILVVILLVIFGPLLTIWVLNTLFPSLAIAYTLKTWLAALLLGAFFSGVRSKD